MQMNGHLKECQMSNFLIDRIYIAFVIIMCLNFTKLYQDHRIVILPES